MQHEKKYKTLVAKGDQIWIEEEDQLHDLFDRVYGWQDADVMYPKDILKDTIRRYFQSKMEKANQYVTRVELNEVKQRISTLEQKLDTVLRISHSPELDSALGDITFETKGLVEKTLYKYQDEQLNVYLISNQFSKELLDRISEIEIALSRKYPHISIELDTVVCADEVPEGSQEM